MGLGASMAAASVSCPDPVIAWGVTRWRMQVACTNECPALPYPAQPAGGGA